MSRLRSYLTYQATRDYWKLSFLALAAVGVFGIFFVTPALTTPSICSVVVTLLFSPIVSALERRGLNRMVSVSVLMLSISLFLFWGGYKAALRLQKEWLSIQQTSPEYFTITIEKIRSLENRAKEQYPILSSMNITNTIIQSSENWIKTTITNTSGLIGVIATHLILVPFFSFFLLTSGQTVRKQFFQLVPNRYFESAYLVSSKVIASFGEFMRAKLFEALLVGGLIWIGLAIIRAPYAAMLSLVAMITNIIPYLGPFLGAAPAIMIPILDPSHAELLWPIVIIYAVVNLIDNIVIFPVLVAKLVNLSPITLLATVIVGQEIYGLIGMLVSIPIATAIKVIAQEIHELVYGRRKAWEPFFEDVFTTDEEVEIPDKVNERAVGA